MGKKLLFSIILIILLGLAIGYFLFNFLKTGNSEPGHVVARVGKAVLTVEDIHKRIPPEYSDFITYQQNVDYVKRWIDTEILYQAALARKIDREPDIRTRISKMQRDLLVSEMISRLSSQNADIADRDVESYYQDHVDKFTRKETEVQYIHINVRTLAEAWKIRSQVTADNFLDLAKQYSLDPIPSTSGLPFLTRNEIMPELADIIFDIKAGGTTPPIKTPFGHYIVKIIDKKTPGTIKPLESVREEIIGRLSSQTRKQRLDELIGTMRQDMQVELQEDLIPGRRESESSSLETEASESSPVPAMVPNAGQ
ncbi:MAG: hypothetical protein A2293_12070 [Elusimicrobia bacterium RIFOXYB2_FULL_49_7]|nr:MAG: hypothetical protein A2293_12070 [Elusimicrobia bacterium RIFOXYB2_FULL_49_7]